MAKIPKTDTESILIFSCEGQPGCEERRGFEQLIDAYRFCMAEMGKTATGGELIPQPPPPNSEIIGYPDYHPVNLWYKINIGCKPSREIFNDAEMSLRWSHHRPKTINTASAWSKYGSMNFFPLWEAILLSLNVVPSSVVEAKYPPYDRGMSLKQNPHVPHEYFHRLEAALRDVSFGTLRLLPDDFISLPDFAAWATSYPRRWTLPEGFPRAVTAAAAAKRPETPQPATQSAPTEKHDEASGTPGNEKPSATVLQNPPKNFFIREGATWRISFDGCAPFTVKDTKGMDGLAKLLNAPEKEWTALLLEGTQPADVNKTDSLPGEATPQNTEMSDQPCLDHRAITAYRDRLEKIEEILGRTSMGTTEYDKLETEKAWIEDALTQGLNRRGDSRTFRTGKDAANDRVRKRLERAILNLESQDKKLGAHLRKCLTKGEAFRYGSSTAEETKRWHIKN